MISYILTIPLFDMAYYLSNQYVIKNSLQGYKVITTEQENVATTGLIVQQSTKIRYTFGIEMAVSSTSLLVSLFHRKTTHHLLHVHTTCHPVPHAA